MSEKQKPHCYSERDSMRSQRAVVNTLATSDKNYILYSNVLLNVRKTLFENIKESLREMFSSIKPFSR